MKLYMQVLCKPLHDFLSVFLGVGLSRNKREIGLFIFNIWHSVPF